MVQRRVDVDREAHERWYGSGVPGFIGQVRALPANALFRHKPDPNYADGDDSTWISVDWPSLTRDETVLGNTRSIMQAGGSGVIFGRNVWQREWNEAVEIVEQIKEIMLSNVTRTP